MAKHEAKTTQSAHPWRATTRTVFTAIIALAALAPVIYSAITQSSPELATGAGAGVLFVAGAITRVMAIPGVEAFLQRFIPWLAAAERNDPAVTEPERTGFDNALRGTDNGPSVADQIHYTGA